MNTEEKTMNETRGNYDPHARIKCCLCGQEIESWQSNNPWPLVDNEESRCCYD